MLRHALDGGFELPVHVAVIGRNGAFITASYVRQDDELRVTNYTATGNASVALPVNVILVDNRGDAARMLIEITGEVRYLH
jgi:hypothetical protein